MGRILTIMQETKEIMRFARGMIGASVIYNGQTCTVIEVLEDKLVLIVEADHPIASIQPDAYGNARREIRTLYSLPILNEATDGLHPSLVNLYKLSVVSGNLAQPVK